MQKKKEKKMKCQYCCEHKNLKLNKIGNVELKTELENVED